MKHRGLVQNCPPIPSDLASWLEWSEKSDTSSISFTAPIFNVNCDQIPIFWKSLTMSPPPSLLQLMTSCVIRIHMQNWGVVHLGHIGASAVAKGCDLLKGKIKYLKRNLTESILTFNKYRSIMTDFYLSIHPVYPLSYPPQINVDYENRLILVVNHLSTPYIFGTVYIDFGDAIIGNKRSV